MKLLILLLLLTSCSANWHFKRALQKGLKPAEQTKVEHDTIYTEVLRDSVIELNTIDTVLIKQLCDTVKVKVLVGAAKLKKQLCSLAPIDSTYEITLTAQGKRYDLPLHVRISVGSGNLSYAIESGALRVPVEVRKVEDTFTAKYGVPVGWFIASLFLALIAGFVAGKLVKLSI